MSVLQAARDLGNQTKLCKGGCIKGAQVAAASVTCAMHKYSYDPWQIGFRDPFREMFIMVPAVRKKKE